MMERSAASAPKYGAVQGIEVIREILAWPAPCEPEQEGRFAEGRKALNEIIDWGARKDRARFDAETRSEVLEAAVRHVVRYGKLGKQTERRLRAALRAVEVNRGA